MVLHVSLFSWLRGLVRAWRNLFAAVFLFLLHLFVVSNVARVSWRGCPFGRRLSLLKHAAAGVGQLAVVARTTS